MYTRHTYFINWAKKNANHQENNNTNTDENEENRWVRNEKKIHPVFTVFVLFDGTHKFIFTLVTSFEDKEENIILHPAKYTLTEFSHIRLRTSNKIGVGTSHSSRRHDVYNNI